MKKEGNGSNYREIEINLNQELNTISEENHDHKDRK